MRRTPLLWIFVFLVVAGIVYVPSFAKFLKLKHRETELKREIGRLQEQILQLQNEEHLLKTDLTRLEEAARQELGLVKPGEIVYKVVEEEIPEKTTSEIQTANR